MISVWFWLVGMKFGKLSKSIVKSPCSPQPAVGVAVADEAGNGLVAFVELLTAEDGDFIVDVVGTLERVVPIDFVLTVPYVEDPFAMVAPESVDVSKPGDAAALEEAGSTLDRIVVFKDDSGTLLDGTRADGTGLYGGSGRLEDRVLARDVKLEPGIGLEVVTVWPVDTMLSVELIVGLVAGGFTFEVAPAMLLFAVIETGPKLEAPADIVDVMKGTTVKFDVELVLAVAGITPLALFVVLELGEVRGLPPDTVLVICTAGLLRPRADVGEVVVKLL